MSDRRLVLIAAVASVVVALPPRSTAHADQRIYLPFAFGPACAFETLTYGPTPGPLPTLAARRWEHLRPPSDVQALTRDERTGDVWSAGFDGVVRWSADGTTVTPYAAAEGLPYSESFGLAIGPNGTVWAPGEDRDEASVVSRLRADGQWESVRSPVDVQRIAVDRAGGVWAGGESGTARLGTDCGWEFPPRGFPLASRAAILDILAASNGDVWIATAGYRGWLDAPVQPPGVAVRRADGEWRTFVAADGLRVDEGRITDLAEAPDGRVWAILDPLAHEQPPAPALIDVLGADGRWTPAPIFVAKLVHVADVLGPVVTWDAAGRPWFRRKDRILVPDDTRPGRWKEVSPPFRELPGEADMKWVTSLVVDDHGVAWVGGRLGGLLQRLPDGTWRTASPTRPKFPKSVAADRHGVWMDTVHRDAEGVWRAMSDGFPPQAAVINDVAIAPDGVWFATSDGLVRRAADGAWTHFTVPRALGGHNVLAVAAATDGSVWAAAGTETTGPLVTRHRPDERWEPHSIAEGQPSGVVRGLVAGTDGAVWLGLDVEGGRRVLSFRSDGTVEEIDLPGYYRNDQLLAMAGDASGALWLFGPKHLLLRRAADMSWIHFAGQPSIDLSPRFESDPPRAMTLAIAPDGSAWIGGLDGEIRVRRPDGTWRSLMLHDGSAVADIAFTPDGRAWMTMADGASPRMVEVEVER